MVLAAGKSALIGACKHHQQQQQQQQQGEGSMQQVGTGQLMPGQTVTPDAVVAKQGVTRKGAAASLQARRAAQHASVQTVATKTLPLRRRRWLRVQQLPAPAGTAAPSRRTALTMMTAPMSTAHLLLLQ
jgi:hypothetical protein